MKPMPVENGGWCIKISVGRSGCLGEATGEPGEAGGAKGAADLARKDGIEADQAERPVLDRVVEEFAGRRQIALVGEGVAQRVAMVVVAGDDVDRHRQPVEGHAEAGVVLRKAAVGEIARRQDDVRRRVQAGGDDRCRRQAPARYRSGRAASGR